MLHTVQQQIMLLEVATKGMIVCFPVCPSNVNINRGNFLCSNLMPPVLVNHNSNDVRHVKRAVHNDPRRADPLDKMQNVQ